MLGFMIISGCKKSSNDNGGDDSTDTGIVGTWNLSIVYKNNSVVNRVITFAGTATEGTFTDDLGDSGSYRVGDITVYFTKKSKFSGVVQYFVGIFSGENNMSGTFIGTDTGTGTWAASR